jgi:hypothetical protein
MKPTELIIVATVHLVAFSIAAFVIHFLSVGDPGLALVVGASAGSGIAAMLYHRRDPDLAPFSVKAAAGGVLSVMAIVTGISSQALLNWMTYPDVVISISAIGSFFFPLAIFGTMQKAYKQKASNKKPDAGDGL